MGGLLDSRWAFRLRKPKHRRCRDNLARRTVSHPCFSLTNHSLLCPYCVCQCKHSNWFICLFIFCKVMKKIYRKQIFTPVGATRWNGEIGTSAWALAFPSEWLTSPLRELEGAVLGDFLNLQLGVSQPHVWIDWTDSLDSTSCRGLVIETARVRRCDSEGSL